MTARQRRWGAVRQPVIDPGTETWLDALAAGASGPPLYELSPADARQVLRDVQASVPVELEPAEVHDRSIEGGPTGAVELRIVRPERRGGALPVVLYTHGGGWILGDKDTHERLVREVADAAGAVVVFVDYTPAPEAHYPVQTSRRTPRSSGWPGTQRRSAATRRGSRSWATASAAAQVLLYPVTDADFETPTYERYADGPWLTRPAMQWFWDAYTPDVVRRAEPTACIRRPDRTRPRTAAAAAGRRDGRAATPARPRPAGSRRRSGRRAARMSLTRP